MQCLARDPRQAPERFLAPISSICTTAVPQGVRRHALGDTRQARGGVHGAPKLAGRTSG